MPIHKLPVTQEEIKALIKIVKRVYKIDISSDLSEDLMRGFKKVVVETLDKHGKIVII